MTSQPDMLTARRITLESWLTQTYGQDGPCLDTARRWCRDGKIYPKPEKHGRSYFLTPEARYTESPTLLDRINADRAKAAQPG